MSKLCALILVFISPLTATAQTATPEPQTPIERELGKAKGVALLTEIEATFPEIKSFYTRISAQLQTAKLLWDIDEKRASKCLADAMAGLKEFYESLDPDVYHYQDHSGLLQLRYEIVQVLTGRDPEAAIDFLRSTNQMIDRNGNHLEHLMQDRVIELTIADQISRKDPHRALQLARRNLKEGYSSHLVHTISQIRQQNPELAAELANEIADKLLNEKLLQKFEAASLALGLVNFSRVPVRRMHSQNGPEMAPALLPEDKYRKLCQKILTEALSYTQRASQSHSPERDTAWNMIFGLKQMGPVLDTIVPGGAAAVEKKIAEFNGSAYVQQGSSPQYGNIIGTNPVDEALEGIGKVPVEQREQLYIQLANRESSNGDLTRAKQIINDHVSNPYQRRQSLLNLEQQRVTQAMNKGKVEEALQALTEFPNNRERAQQLAQIANQIGPGQKQATALLLLEQARSLLGSSVQAQDEDHMNALFEIARAFSRYDSKRSFEIIDPLIEQFNELCTAARTLDGFGGEYYNEEELEMQNGGSLAQLAGQMSAVLGSLALTNFDRAKSSTDRIRLPGVRIKAYLEIAQQTIRLAK